MNQERIQEKEYDFPYHHLVSISPFSETKHLFWGYRYAGYIEKIVEILSQNFFDSLVEIGCGDGRVLTEISRNFPKKHLVGIDYSEKALRFAKAFSPHLTFLQKTNEQFDCFVLIEVLEHINPKEMTGFLNSISNNLKPGGFGIITTPSINIHLHDKHYQHFTPESIQKTLNEQFDIVSMHHISVMSFGVKVIQIILANRFFILNNKAIIRRIYSIYKRYYVDATKKNGSQILAIVKKKTQ